MHIFANRNSAVKRCCIPHRLSFHKLQHALHFDTKILRDILRLHVAPLLPCQHFFRVVHLADHLAVPPRYSYNSRLVSKIVLNLTNQRRRCKAAKLHPAHIFKSVNRFHQRQRRHLKQVIKLNTTANKFFGNDLCDI